MKTEEKIKVDKKDVKILVATHKPYKMPEEEMYLPIYGGAEEKENIKFQGDNEGDNISNKNPYYCELTSLYWAWKNMENDYIGITHYRRHFKTAKSHNKDKLNNILTKEEVESYLQDVDIILPKKRHYYIENLYSHYKHTMYVEPLDEAGKIIEEKYPEYSKEFERLKTRKSAHIFNMFIMKKELLDRYCQWLFDILFELEKRVDPKQYNNFHARYLGRVSELLLDVWINTNNLNYKEIKAVDIERVNWIKKGLAFLNAKFTGKRYEGSF